jgi:hypothetical protein
MKVVKSLIAPCVFLMTFLVGGISLANDSKIFDSVSSDSSLAAPTLTVTTFGRSVKISWTSVQIATSYTLFYAPYPSISYIGQLDMGTKTSLTVEVDGLAFYVAVQAYNSSGNSPYSNIEYFDLSVSDETFTTVPVNKLETHDPDDEIDYAWFTYLPSGINKTDKTYLVVEGTAGLQSNNYDEVVADNQLSTNNPIPVALRKKGFPYIKIVIPSPALGVNDVNDYSRYPQGLYRGSFVTTNAFKRRPDLRLNKMIDKYLSALRQNGYNMSDKVFMYGFSISGAFTIHYATMYPERLKAIAPGSPGFMTIPEVSYNGEAVTWPVGIADLYDLSGIIFDFETFKQIPIFLWIGDEDQTTPVCGYNQGAEGWEDTIGGVTFLKDQNNFIHDNFGTSGSEIGKDQVEIMTNSTNYYKSLGIPIELKIYPGVAHNCFASTMTEDVIQFFVDNK